MRSGSNLKVCLKPLPWSSSFILYVDSRRAVFHIGTSTYSAKLVDLPCIAESQKTLDNKQMFKVADICQVGDSSIQCSYHCGVLMQPASQMLVVENKIDNDEPVSNQRTFNIDEFIWPHGITPPLHHVRKRRFRKRVNRRVGLQFLSQVNSAFQSATDD